MRIVFMGTPEFAVPSLNMLIENFDVCGVVTQPDRPKGRGKKLVPSPVKETAEKAGIPVFQPLKVKESEFIKTLEELNPDLIVVAAYGQILPESILNMPKFGCINVHGSLLPKLRGAAPIQWSIINGDKVTGVTIMYMEKGLDTGDMLYKAEMEILPCDTYGTLAERMANVGADALKETIKLMTEGKIVPEKQDNELSTYAPMIKKELEHIDFSKTTTEIANLVRGLSPQPGAYTLYNDDILKVWETEAFEGEISGNTGEIIGMVKKGIVVKTADGAIVLTKIQAKGGKILPTDAYLRGHSIETGTILK